MVVELTDAVGRASADGNPAANHAIDQQLIIELLDARWQVPEIPLVERLPPVEEGVASEEFCVEIARFQESNGLAVADGRVDVGGSTWQALLSLAQPMLDDPQSPPVLLSLNDYEIRELPRIASGLPSITYSVESQEPPCVLYGPGYTIELKVSGPLKVDWGNALPFAVAASPSTASLQTNVNDGSIRSVSALRLRDDSSELQTESRVAIGSLFAGVTLALGADGAPVLGGTIGNPEGFIGFTWDPDSRSITYRAERQVLKEVTTRFGADVTITGRLRVELKVTSAEPVAEPASIVASVVVIAALGYVVIPGVIALVGEGAMAEVISVGLAKLVPDALIYVQ